MFNVNHAFYSCKIVPQGDTINLQNKMAVNVTKKVKYTMALYHATFYMESFMLFSKNAHLLDYTALLKFTVCVL